VILSLWHECEGEENSRVLVQQKALAPMDSLMSGVASNPADDERSERVGM